MTIDQSKIQSIQEYWTPERKANAIPSSLPQVETPEIDQQKYHEFSKTKTEMSFCGSQVLPYAPRVDVNKDPYCKAGKLFYTKEDGENYYGTAQFVESPNIILTAAHCLKASCADKWYGNIMFHRARSDETAEQEVNIVVKHSEVHSGWDTQTTFTNRIRWNYGFAKTTENSDVGYLKLLTYLPEELKAIGYPQNYGNKGQYMRKVHGTRGECIHGRVQMNGNWMDGSAGGAWFARHGDKEVVGISVSENFGGVCGPIFNKETLDLLHRVQNKK